MVYTCAIIIILTFTDIMYIQVRIKAQNVLSLSADRYLYAGRMILPDILPFLKSGNGATHEQFKVIDNYHIILIWPIAIHTVWNIDTENIDHTLFIDADWQLLSC